MNEYASLDELNAKEEENTDYEISYKDGLSDVAVIAIHGGGIEPGTSEIAEEISGTEHSFYSFKGIKDKNNRDLHLDSRVFDEPKCIEIVNKSARVVAIHGSDRPNIGEESILLGGLDDDLKNKIQNHLKSAGFKVEKTPDDLLGIDKNNICNKGKNKIGVQIEIQNGLRSNMFEGNHKKKTDRKNKTAVFDNFVSAIRAAISEKD